MSADALARAIRSAKEIKEKGDLALTRERAISEGLKLVEECGFCMLGTNGEDGFPNIKAMTNIKHEGLKKIWFSTKTSSRRVLQLKKDNRACVYYVDEKLFKGLMLIGTAQVLRDHDSKKMLWAEGAEVYYPLGVEDPDYSVVCFSAERGNYYHGLKNVTFEVE